MDRALVYHVSQMVVGGGFTMIGVSTIQPSDPDGAVGSISAALMIVGGIGMLLGNGYYVLTSNTDRVELGPVTFWVSVAGAVLVFLAGMLSLAS
ncbi:hypothetical protein [Natrinema salaciae]|uniref:hypothetical protein n=1 Tax=Natrinema salaciae TaxID=1186196 RepID=UPI000B86DF34|nr:hypothetical protein [Natrinema salaciae]